MKWLLFEELIHQGVQFFIRVIVDRDRPGSFFRAGYANLGP